mgnify:CR=1 FL=1|tara:strand:- start:1194 stop:2468 length:1275 start_codon:yes stop_codon:yes gene_type:complete
METEDIHIAVIGLGYVGLPLAIEFSKKFQTVGYDIDEIRVKELINDFDRTNEVESEELKNNKSIVFTSNVEKIQNCNIYIVTAPTPINKNKTPDLNPLIRATETVGSLLKKDDIVIYESTVYPGATEEVCVPVLEEVSGLKFNQEFFCGYSPERINPGDKEHNLTNIVKVTSGSTDETLVKVDELYKHIVEAGTYKAPSIKVAEAAKIIENTQRDINIALINELAVIFNKLNIDTQSVLEAAETKWNFLSFRPGLVGGHCIGVDPYYLTYKAESIGYSPNVILSGRRINNHIPVFIANEVTNLMLQKSIKLRNSRALILGITFKENCPDIRNSLVLSLIESLEKYEIDVDVYDPIASYDEVYEQYGISLISKPLEENYDVVILAVNHAVFCELQVQEIKKWAHKKHILYDIKHVFSETETDGRL